jgi:UDP-N-acetylglucosamine 4-epimerase
MTSQTFHDQDISEISFLVTGGAGFIGSNIVSYLMQHGAGKVRVLDNLDTGNRVNIAEFEALDNFEFMEGDIRDLETCLKATEGMDLVIHKAALGSVPRSIKEPRATLTVNSKGFQNIMIAANSNNVDRVVYATSSSVYGDDATLPKVEEKTGMPLSLYAATKVSNELTASVFASAYNMSCIGLRYFNIFGPNQSPEGPYAAVIPLFMEAALSSEQAVIDGSGEQTRDFTYVENAVQANIRAALSSKEIKHAVYNIAVGQKFSVNELHREINALTGSSIEPKHAEDRAGDIPASLANIEKAQQDLGYEPSVTFQEGLKRTLTYWKEAQDKN